jgi:copper transport protein
MAVSMWVGGLFYISTVLLSAIRANTTISKTATATSTIASTPSKIPKKTVSNKEKEKSTTTLSETYYLALLLPRFSLIATISLGVIGVSGLYMAWIHLDSINALFDTSYGNTLIIKLSAILPLVLLGAYHQLILHRNVALAANIGRQEGKGKGKEVSSSFEDWRRNNSDGNCKISWCNRSDIEK